MLVFVLLVYPSFVWGGSDISVYHSFTWQTDLEWNAWSFNKIEVIGSNQGIRLSDLSKGGYEKQGEATFKFSPGGNNKWVKVNLGSDSAQNAKKYIWASIHNKDSVSQIDPENGEIVKEWDVGDNPSRTSIGCNNDAWVGNRGNPSSISHIIPAENKVITRRLPNSLNTPRSVSIDCSTNPDYLWVGGNGRVVKINTTAFDALGASQLATAAQVGSTVTIWAGEPYSTYGSVLGEDGNYLYIASWTYDGLPWWGGSTNNSPTYKINTATHAIVDNNTNIPGTTNPDTGLPYKAYAARGNYVITNDWLGNIWRDKVCVRIDPDDGTTDSLCANGSKGISIIPEISGVQSPKIVWATADNNLCTADLVDNDTVTPSMANLSCTTDKPLGGTDVFGVGISGGGIGYDDDYDIWFLPRKGAYITEFKQSENYLISHQYSPTSKSGGGIYSYSDFLGNALDNSTGASITQEYSVDGVNYFLLNPDGTFPSEIDPSSDLYIRIKMNGSGTNTPILRSLQIEYEPESFSNLRTIRTTHTSSLARDSGTEESTFERGETVYTRIKLYEPEKARSGTSITDRFSNVKDPRNFRFKKGCSGSGSAINLKASSVNEVSFDIDLPLGLSCIDYEYTAD